MARKKKKKSLKVQSAELNVMPFIDIFSMLNTFLLVSAAFVGLGVLEVQVPFFTNAPPTKEKPSRSMSIKIDLTKEDITVTTEWSAPPVDKKETKYSFTAADLEKLHKDMISLRTRYPEEDKVTVYSDDNVKYEKFVSVIDQVKTLHEGDPDLPEAAQKVINETKTVSRDRFLYEKIVIGSVVL